MEYPDCGAHAKGELLLLLRTEIAVHGGVVFWRLGWRGGINCEVERSLPIHFSVLLFEEVHVLRFQKAGAVPHNICAYRNAP